MRVTILRSWVLGTLTLVASCGTAPTSDVDSRDGDAAEDVTATDVVGADAVNDGVEDSGVDGSAVTDSASDVGDLGDATEDAGPPGCAVAFVHCGGLTPATPDVEVGAPYVCSLRDAAGNVITPESEGPFRWRVDVADTLSEQLDTRQSSMTGDLGFAGRLVVQAEWEQLNESCAAEAFDATVEPPTGFFAQVIWTTVSGPRVYDLNIHLLRVPGCWESPPDDMTPPLESGDLDWGVTGETADDPYILVGSGMAPGGEAVGIREPARDERFLLAIEGVPADVTANVREMVWWEGALVVDHVRPLVPPLWRVVATIAPADDVPVVASEREFSDQPDCE